MKSATYYLIAICFCTSVSFGTFDRVISDSYEHVTVNLNSESLLVTGAGAFSIRADGSSYVEIVDTAPLQVDVGGIADLSLDDSSSLHYFGGETSLLDMRDHASAVIEGGQINLIRSFQYVLHPNQEVLWHIEIVCDYHVFDDSTNYLSGTWMDGSSFGIQLVDQPGYDRVIDNMFFTPEPATLLLLGLGGLVVRKRKRF